MESLRKLSGGLARLSTNGPLGENPFARVSELTVKEDGEKLERESLKPGTIVDDGIPRTGSLTTAVGHTITAVIGAGVLNLPYAVSILGWVAGPILLLLFSWVTLYTSYLLADCHVFNGRRMRTYTDVVFVSFGRTGYHVLGWVQHSNLLLTALSYQITGSLSVQTVARSFCRQAGNNSCPDNLYIWAIVFAGIQLFMIQAPDLSSLWWVSLMGAVMSFGYSLIALGLSIAKGNTHGTVGGRSLPPVQKGFGALNAMGSILYAYAFSMILIEIQDTIRPDKKNDVIKPMRNAVTISVGLMTAFYVAVAVAGYMAFGNTVPPNVLTGFSNPSWLIDLANIMLILHMLPAYQVYLQPLVAFVEDHFNAWEKAPTWLRGLTFRITLRSTLVVLIGFVGILMPFFNDIVGLVGAVGFWPATVYFPIECWIRMYKPQPTLRFWLRFLNIGCAVVSLAATVGSVYSIVDDASTYKIFAS